VPDAKAAAVPDAKAAAVPDAKAEPKPGPESETPSAVTPQIVKRVHELYEELGREEVQAVQDWEKKKGQNRTDEPHK
jgi:H+-transporting ATPase